MANASNAALVQFPQNTGAGQTTSEATYTGYARVAVARGAGTWTVV